MFTFILVFHFLHGRYECTEVRKEKGKLKVMIVYMCTCDMFLNSDQNYPKEREMQEGKVVV